MIYSVASHVSTSGLVLWKTTMISMNNKTAELCCTGYDNVCEGCIVIDNNLLLLLFLFVLGGPQYII